MNPPVIQNPPLTLNPSMNQSQGPTVSMISTEPRAQDVEITIVTHGGTTMGDEGPLPQVQLARKNKVMFDIVTEKETFFEMRDAI